MSAADEFVETIAHKLLSILKTSELHPQLQEVVVDVVTGIETAIVTNFSKAAVIAEPHDLAKIAQACKELLAELEHGYNKLDAEETKSLRLVN